MPLFEFHVSRRARDLYGFDDALFSFNGTVIFADFQAALLFAHQINLKRPPSEAVPAGRLNALGLIDELQHFVLRSYREQKNPDVMSQALVFLKGRHGDAWVEQTLRSFLDEFPPVSVYKNLITAEEFLEAAISPESADLSRRPMILEEMLMLKLANLNPACGPLRELFDDEPLAPTGVYDRLTADLQDFFETQPPFGPDNENLIDFLRAPALAAPQSLAAQLAYMRGRWGIVLGERVSRLWRGLDFIKEEEQASFSGPGPSLIPVFGFDSQAASQAIFGHPAFSPFDPTGSFRISGSAGPSMRPLEPETERFSADLDWMPNLVLIAKNTFVWLDQLSKKYGRSVVRLDQIPDAELDLLRSAGVTCLWLIGLWERSGASRRIKQIMGNPEAVASAYSLYDYAIAADLGGEAALLELKARALKYRIRLASDMVPNHMGLDSRWVVEHPDWFIGLDQSAYPAYTFNGPDLSGDERVRLQIEDHYFNRTDAAVVFKRTDLRTGGVRYLYHGNDGTSFPWNDTAQLDFLKAEVREAVTQTILHVARLFPVIRFDAAMTLAKRHFQRLWYPEPGTGGAIPSRAEHGLTKEEFDARIPEEFWRTVVDRVAAEAPETLLLAEAFWLMEGYFVRTLGMHRVYNSAFMNMLRDEENAKYRRVMKNTLAFDPEVLKRYVNFMNNPDERTATEQFGDGDKYFGVCTMLATLPGLPMVGHGQFEGLTEKYGMEYRRAYFDETPKPWFADRHAREIFPLFHKRYLFAGAAEFLLYDFITPEGSVDENVFAYSNGAGGERVLVVYHNKYAETRGWIFSAAPYSVHGGEDENKTRVEKKLGDGLRLRGGASDWVIFKDQVSGLEYLRNSGELRGQGLFLELSAYRCGVFTDFREVRNADPRLYPRLAEQLRGRGVPDIEKAAAELLTRPVQTPFRELVHPGFLRWLEEQRVVLPGLEPDPRVGGEIEWKARHILDGIEFLREHADPGAKEFPSGLRQGFETILRLPVLQKRFPKPRSKTFAAAVRYLKTGRSNPPTKKAPRAPGSVTAAESMEVYGGLDEKSAWAFLFGWMAMKSIRGFFGGGDPGSAESPTIDDWKLDRVLESAFRELGIEDAESGETVQAITALAGGNPWPLPGFPPAERARLLASMIFDGPDFRNALQVNSYQGVEYFNKEAFERMMWRLLATAAVDLTAASEAPPGQVADALVAAHKTVLILLCAESESGYRVGNLLEILRGRIDQPGNNTK